MGTHGSILDVAVPCCQFGYPVNDGRDVGGPVQLDLRKAVLVRLHHPLDLWSEGRDGRGTVSCSNPQPDVWQHLPNKLVLASLRFLAPKRRSEWLRHLFCVHERAPRNRSLSRRFLSSTTTCTGPALPSHSSSSGLKFMAKSWETCRRGRGWSG